MSEPFIGEIRIFAGNFAPVGWAFCNGQLLSISENDAFFALIGTTYGGDGQSTFALPDLRSRLPMHAGPGFVLAQPGGVETVTLTISQIPAHQHNFLSGPESKVTSPENAALAPSLDATVTTFGADLPQQAYPPALVTVAGGSQPHDNRQPYLGLSFIIALVGIFPSQS